MTVQDESATSTATHGVILTDAAAAKAKALLDQEGRDDLALRIAVQPGGCAGLRYNLFFDDRSLDGDLTAEFGGVNADRRPDERALHAGRHHRLRRHHREAGLHHRQPERHRIVRVRGLVQLIRSGQYCPAVRSRYEHTSTSSSWASTWATACSSVSAAANSGSTSGRRDPHGEQHLRLVG